MRRELKNEPCPADREPTAVWTILKGERNMSTFMQKNETVVRKWYVVDAAEKPMGKTAVAVADLLRGKNEPTFTPNADCGNFVIVINAEKAVLTGRKLEQKYYYSHSGYIGGLKAVQAKTMMATKPERAMEIAIKGMLPHNHLGRKAFNRLKVYAGAAHNHEAQKPETYEL
jgi:large subunit ribosomal protein L13